MTEPTFIPVTIRRRARLALATELLQAAPSLLTVLSAAGGAVMSREGRLSALVVAELLVGLWVLVSIMRGVREHFLERGTMDGHARVASEDGWIDTTALAAVAFGYVEVWRRAYDTGHFRPFGALMVSATVTLVLALGGRAAIRRRFRHRRSHVLVSDDAISMRAGPWTRWMVAWADVEGVALADDAVTMRLRDGTQRLLRRADFLGGASVLEAVRSAIRAHASARISA